jgi:hypothetical protein
VKCFQSLLAKKKAVVENSTPSFFAFFDSPKSKRLKSNVHPSKRLVHPYFLQFIAFKDYTCASSKTEYDKKTPVAARLPVRCRR